MIVKKRWKIGYRNLQRTLRICVSMQKLEMNLSQEILEHSRNFAPPNESIVPGFIKRFYGDEQEELVAPIQPTWFAVFDSFLYVYSRGPSELDVQAAQDVIWILDSTLKKISSGQAQEPELAKLFEDGWCPVEVMNSRIQTKVWIFVKQKEFNDFYARLKLGCTRKDDIQLKLTKKTHKAEYYEKLFLKEVNQDNGRVKFSNSVDSAITISEDMFTNGDFFQHPDSSAESKEFSLESASREPKLSKNLVNLDLEDNSNVYRESSFSSDSECESVGRDTLLSKEEKFIKTENTEVEVIRRLAKSFADGFDDTLFSSGVIEESNHDRRQRLEDDSGKNEDIAIAKIWACTWNMGVKDIFKLPSDSTAAEADYFKKIHLENFKKCIPSGFQLYVFAVQECISERFFELLSEYLEPMGCQRVVLDPEKDRVWGRGDGSFINPKFTGIAIYMHYDLLPKFSLLRIGARNLSMFEGSKGVNVNLLFSPLYNELIGVLFRGQQSRFG